MEIVNEAITSSDMSHVNVGTIQILDNTGLVRKLKVLKPYKLVKHNINYGQ